MPRDPFLPSTSRAVPLSFLPPSTVWQVSSTLQRYYNVTSRYPRKQELPGDQSKKTSPLARRKSIRLKDLAHENLLLIDRHISPGAYDKTLELYRDAGLTPKIVATETMSYDEAGAILVESGKGVYLAVGKNPCHPSFADRLVALPLGDPSAVMSVNIVWRKDERTKALLDFVKSTRGKFEQTGEVRCLTRDLDGILRLSLEPTKRVRPASRRTRHGRR